MMAARELQQGPGLRELLAGIVDHEGVDGRPVGGLATDSRQVQAGGLFLARPGAVRDARDYVDQAIAAGAVAVLMEAPAVMVEHRNGVPLIGVRGLVGRLGTIADRFFGFPSRQMWVAGVTGTNGKTSVTHFVAQALQAGGEACGLVGTLGNGTYGALHPGRHTTPDVVTVHRILRELSDRGVGRAVLEASSHGLEQGRLDGITFDVAVFTNLSREHLDYHRDMAAYASAKGRLFRVPGLRYAVVNMDDPAAPAMLEGLAAPVELVGFSLAGERRRAALAATRVELGPTGLVLEVSATGAKARLASPLLGRFNAANLMAALATLTTLGVPLEEAAARLEGVRPVAGRMERFAGGSHQPLVVVDYAHTPDALGQALRTLRQHCGGRLWCVFGCGGERDRGKRPEMGRAAQVHADQVVLTDDNPRGEDGDAIIGDILSGMMAPAKAVVERRRELAIAGAVEAAGAGDVVLVAGKGHEDYQEVCGRRVPYSDRVVVEALLARGGDAG
jgi:UDP-N-acetylmuramoyl-L-alanyl-D-glutamate--2,6-diaminopimelate ligase